MIGHAPAEEAPAPPRSAETPGDILRAIARDWSRRGIEYAVVNGLEGYPRNMGRDVDVVVAPRQLHDAAEIARAHLQERGRTTIARRRRELVQIIGVQRRGGDALIIDIFPGLRWGPVSLVGVPAPAERTDVFPIDPWASFVKRILLHVLVGPEAKFGGDPARLRWMDGERRAAARTLPPLVGNRLAERTLSAVERGDVSALDRLRPRLRRALVTRAFLRQPLRALAGSGRWLRARVSLAACPAAMPTIGVVGPDGVGKSTLITEVARQARARLRCSRVEVRHWRPGLLPQLGSLAGRPLPRGGVPPRRTAGRFGLLRVLYYGLDFVLGSRFRDRRISRNLGLVVYDRGALDMRVDPLRYGLRPGRHVRRLLRLLPRPDLVVLLRDTPGRIRGRKAELDEPEIRRQLEVWAELTAAGEVDVVLDVDGPPAVLAGRVVDALVDRFLARHAED